MRLLVRLSMLIAILLLVQTAVAQTNRVRYNNQNLFLSGANLAWRNFANDIGPSQLDTVHFADVMLQMHDRGGNALRWWLHTNGTVTPEFNPTDTGLVLRPGTGTIADLKKVLDLAWEREIGLKLCLWSFDMMRTSNSALVKARNRKLLTDTTYTRAYINNCLIPMVDSLKGHPAIIAWEIFNEPEGMANEFGFDGIVNQPDRIPMSAIQRFINLCAGAIHRTDTAAQVTNGSWSFSALTDVQTTLLAKAGPELAQQTRAEQQAIADWFNQKYRASLTVEEVMLTLQHAAQGAGFNYYSDSRLISAGGDPDGALDFYSVHFYSTTTQNPGLISPFNQQASHWNLDKPIVVAEFAMQGTGAPQNIPKTALFTTLYNNGYAGALPWSWTDSIFSGQADMLAGMQSLWDTARAAVDVNGVGGDFPTVAIISPANDTTYAAGAQVTITAVAQDNDGSVIKVEFFANGTIKIGEQNVSIDSTYSVTWTNITPGSYTLTAVVTDNANHQRTSNSVRIQVGALTMKKLEAEAAARTGDVQNILIGSGQGASGGAYLDIRTNDSNTRITWTLPNVPAAGSYEIAFGYRLFYDTPKTQLINVNGAPVGSGLVFDGTAGAGSPWLEKKITVNLVQGSNTIQMQLSWGWMYLDYLAVPASIVSSVENLVGIPTSFALEQNYPNPFNPTTVISFQLPVTSYVTVNMYDLLGREVATLVNEELSTGVYRTTWDATSLPSGVYYYRLEARPTDGGQAGSFTQTRKMLLLK